MTNLKQMPERLWAGTVRFAGIDQPSWTDDKDKGLGWLGYTRDDLVPQIDVEALARALQSLEQAATYFDRAIWEKDHPYGVHPLGDTIKARVWRDGLEQLRRILTDALERDSHE